MEKIISIINKKKDELEKECNEKDICYQKLNHVAEGLKNGAIIIHCDDGNKKEPIEILMRMYLSKVLNKDCNPSFFEETAFLDKIINKTHSSDILDIIDCLDDILSQGPFESILDLFKNNKILLDFSNKPKKIGNIIELSSKIIELKALVAACKFPMTDVLEYMNKYNNTREIMKTICYGACLINGGIGAAAKDELMYIQICTEEIMKNSYDLLHKAKADVTNIRKQLKAHQEISKFLEQNKNKEEITELPKSYKKLDQQTQLQLVKFVYEHNMKYNNKLEKEYLKSSEVSIRNRKQLLQKYKINSDDLYLEYEIEELENILRLCSDMKIINNQDVNSIIKNIDLEKLETIYSQYKFGFIDSSFISKHINIICDDDSTYKNLIFNLRKLKGYKIPKETIISCSEILICDSGTISNNLGIIDTYLYSENLKEATDISFLKFNNINEKLDTMIELGFEDNVGSDLSLLNYDEDRYKRLIILNRLNLLSKDTSEIKSILDKDNFIIPNRVIDEYILNLSSYANTDNNSITKDEFLEKLNKYQVSNRLYEINGVKISKFKVEALTINEDNLTSEKQYKILSHGKNIDSNEYHALINFITNKNYENQKVKMAGKICQTSNSNI